LKWEKHSPPSLKFVVTDDMFCDYVARGTTNDGATKVAVFLVILALADAALIAYYLRAFVRWARRPATHAAPGPHGRRH
jgi:hypothetical protein